MPGGGPEPGVQVALDTGEGKETGPLKLQKERSPADTWTSGLLTSTTSISLWC